MKLSYINATNKRTIREELLKRHTYTKLIGLAGPNLHQYMSQCKRAGIKHVTVYEKNSHVMIKQLPYIIKHSIPYRFMDILHAALQKDTLYDLDFCCSIKSVEQHIKKFKRNFMLTVSERGGAKWWSIPYFLEYRKETEKERIQITKNQLIIKSDKGQYLCTFYQDSSRMLTITSL